MVCRLAGLDRRSPGVAKDEGEAGPPCLPASTNTSACSKRSVWSLGPTNFMCASQTHEYCCRRVYGCSNSSVTVACRSRMRLHFRRALIQDATGQRFATKGQDRDGCQRLDAASYRSGTSECAERQRSTSSYGQETAHLGASAVNGGKRLSFLLYRGADRRRSVKTHRLRDTFAGDLLKAELSLEHVSKLSSHTSVRTMERATLRGYHPSRIYQTGLSYQPRKILHRGRIV